jgi:hypothetical protein
MRKFLSHTLSLAFSLSHARALSLSRSLSIRTHTHDLPDRAPAKVPSFVLGQQIWKVVQAAHFPWIAAHLGLTHPSGSHTSTCQVQLHSMHKGSRTRTRLPELDSDCPKRLNPAPSVAADSPARACSPVANTLPPQGGSAHTV